MPTLEANRHAPDEQALHSDRPPDITEELLHEPSRRELEITPDASELLLGWGLTEQEIGELTEIAAGFEYANLRGKAERIAQRGGYLISEGSDLFVVLPELRDIAGDRRDGQCGEIACKVLRAMHESSWLERVNDRLVANGQLPLETLLAKGKSKTHFFKEASNHVWAGLVQSGGAPEDGLVIDGSFLTISCHQESGYEPESQTVNVEALNGFKPNEKLAVVEYTETSTGIGTLHNTASSVIGVTSDGALALALGIARSEQTGDIRPYIYAWNADQSAAAVALYKNNGAATLADPNSIVDEAHRAEIMDALVVLSAIEIVPDIAAAEACIDEVQNVVLIPQPTSAL